MTEAPPRVDIILLNWNKSALTLACVASLQARTYANARILVVDNGSVEQDVAALQAAEGPFKLVRNQHNLGFTGGVNVGIAQAMADGAAYIWLLNNDAVPTPDTLARLVAAAEADPRVGLASPVIQHMDSDDSIDTCCGLVHSAPLNFERTADPSIAADWMRTSPGRVWLVGTALLVRRSLIEKIGGFDDRFFAYWEDNDYSLRSLAAGFHNIVVPGATVRHEAAPPTDTPHQRPPYYYYYMARNEILLLRRHGGAWRNARSLIWSVRRQFRLLSRLRSYPAARSAIWAALRDAVLGRGGAWRGV